jgi:hypothetical protein
MVAEGQVKRGKNVGSGLAVVGLAEEPELKNRCSLAMMRLTGPATRLLLLGSGQLI